MGLISLRALSAQGNFNAWQHGNMFKAHFGFGGDYVGFIDRAMRLTLLNLYKRDDPLLFCPSLEQLGLNPRFTKMNALMISNQKFYQAIRKHGVDNRAVLHEEMERAVQSMNFGDLQEDALSFAHELVDGFVNGMSQPEGGDDFQMGALARLPTIVARYAGDASFLTQVEAWTRATHNTDQAVAYVLPVARLLEHVLLHPEISPRQATLDLLHSFDFTSVPAAHRADVQAQFNAVLAEQNNADSTSVTNTFGKACFLRTGVPAALHVLLHAESYQDGVHRALLGGGDCVGRAALIGAVLAAHYGIGTEKGVPQAWISQTKCASELVKLAESIQQQRSA
eukprot:TRINITY_DN1405_c0_g3_i4.p1 TRINITY_DN1405_c0_g3~~TRINITY_DN1405_c0_g3_i4.p1  ORF type:complete len:392 (+),score=117.42 TRINITY_DN1405_c0_g3_i4:164-1177(+)